jgi:hypothetical protein
MASARFGAEDLTVVPCGGTDFSGAVGKAITITTGVAAIAGANAPRILGVAFDDPNGTAQTNLTVQHNGEARAIAGAAITYGQELTTDASGRFVAATSTQNVLGIALQAASGANSMFRMLIRHTVVK